MSRSVWAAAVRPANVRRPEMHPTAAACPEAYSAAVPAKARAVSAAATMSPAAMSPAAAMPAAAMPAATAAAGVCFECEKRHDEEQYRGHASASRQHKPRGAAGLDAPLRRSRL